MMSPSDYADMIHAMSHTLIMGCAFAVAAGFVLSMFRLIGIVGVVLLCMALAFGSVAVFARGNHVSGHAHYSHTGR